MGRRKEHERKQREGATNPANEGNERKHASSTEGTNRDFDENEESRNQGHGHPREERGRTTEQPGT